MIFGYARVSTDSQKLDLQLDALLKSGIKKKISIQIFLLVQNPNEKAWIFF